MSGKRRRRSQVFPQVGVQPHRPIAHTVLPAPGDFDKPLPAITMILGRPEILGVLVPRFDR